MGQKFYKFDAEQLTTMLARTVPDDKKKFVKYARFVGGWELQGTMSITAMGMEHGSWHLDEPSGELWWAYEDVRYFVTKLTVLSATG